MNYFASPFRATAMLLLIAESSEASG